MKKIRVVTMLVQEFEPNPSWYLKGTSIEDMLQIEMENAQNDPIEYYYAGNPTIEVKGEIVNE